MSLNKKRTEPKTYFQNFVNDSGGWFGVISNQQPVTPLKIENDSVVSCSPWWVDYNHAPPGGGYLHLIMAIMTKIGRAHV